VCKREGGRRWADAGVDLSFEAIDFARDDVGHDVRVFLLVQISEPVVQHSY
jgi:hypothetical protein